MRTRQRLRIAALTLALGLTAPLVSTGGTPAAEATTGTGPVVYVATDGDDSNAGTLEAPFATITAARDALAGRTSAEEVGTVWIRGGEYTLNEAITLSGEENSWVTYGAYRGEDVQITGAHELPAEDWQRLGDLSEDELAQTELSSQSRLPAQVREDVWVYDLGEAEVNPGTLYKNGFNWVPQPFAPELSVDGGLQTLAQYPNEGDCSTTETECHLWGTGDKWGADGTEDLIQQDLDERFGLQDDWQTSGTTPRSQFEDKKQTREDTDTWSLEEMYRMTPSIFEIGGRLLEEDRYQSWAPQAVPTIEDAGTRGFDEYADIPVQADPAWIEDIDNSQYETEGWLSGYLGNNYAVDMVRILSWDGTTMYTKYPSMYIPQDEWTKVTAINILSELDVAGEYYIDRYDGNDVLYFLPEDGTIEGHTISLSTFDDNFFRLEGTTGVTLRGLTMTDSLTSGVQLLDAHDTLIDGVEIANVSMDAVRIGETTESITAMPDYEAVRGGTGNVVQNSFLHDLGGGGVLLGGGDRDTLEPGNNVARHNEIARFSRLATYTPAGYLYGVGNTFEYNEVYDAPHMAIQIMGNDMQITNNYFHDLVLNAGDQGVIYTGRDYTYLGNEVAYNLFEGIGGSNDAFYMDDGASGMRFHHNVVKDARSGLYFQSGHSNTANDNVFIDVDRTGHDRQYALDGEPGLPVSNAWVVHSRFNAFLDVREGEKYSATPEIVQTWHEHYTSGEHQYTDGQPILFPEIEDWYIPRVTETGEECLPQDYAVDATNGCGRASVWEDPNSLYVPARVEIDHSVIIGGGEYEPSTANFSDPAAEYTLSTWSEKINTNLVQPETTEAAGFDLGTMQFTEAGQVAETFGTEWVQTWNSLVSRDGIGRPEAGDTTELWETVAQAEELLAGDPGGDTSALEEALAHAFEVGDRTDASQAEIDDAREALRTELEALLPPAPGAAVLSDDNNHDGLRGGDFTITANLWWGQNGTSFRLYEDGELIAEEALSDDTPRAQEVSVPIEGRPNGEYTYTCELVNAGGATECDPHTVVVDAASPGTPVLSHDNWDGDGDFTLSADLWWGTNATSWTLAEDGEEIDSGELTARTPQAQHVEIPVTDRESGSRTYVVTFSNELGSTDSAELTVPVD